MSWVSSKIQGAQKQLRMTRSSKNTITRQDVTINDHNCQAVGVSSVYVRGFLPKESVSRIQRIDVMRFILCLVDSISVSSLKVNNCHDLQHSVWPEQRAEALQCSCEQRVLALLSRRYGRVRSAMGPCAAHFAQQFLDCK
jgi:hypothetical protein